MSTLHYLFRETVDYAGLFPPAALPLEEVVANYARYLDSPEQSMLARLIIPSKRLDEFATIAEPFFESSNQQPWKISALIPPVEALGNNEVNSTANASAQDAIKAFNETHSRIASVDTIEVRVSESTIASTIAAVPHGQNAFLEIPWNVDPTPFIVSILQSKLSNSIFAKIRTGGVTPDLIPPARNVARFIDQCSQSKLGFKATAGLHHPIRANQKLTYKADAPEATLHGFVNVFVASALAFAKQIPQEIIEQILEETIADSFVLSDQQVGWKEHILSADEVKRIRESDIISFGSCSFVEPINELESLPQVQRSAVFS